MSPDVAVPAEFDQFFVFGWCRSVLGAGRREREERTFEFVFAYVDGGWGIDYVGGEVVDHFQYR